MLLIFYAESLVVLPKLNLSITQSYLPIFYKDKFACSEGNINCVEDGMELYCLIN